MIPVTVVRRLAEEGSLRKDLGPADATAIVWALTGYDLYRALVTEQHWTAARYESWLTALLVGQLLRP